MVDNLLNDKDLSEAVKLANNLLYADGIADDKKQQAFKEALNNFRSESVGIGDGKTTVSVEEQKLLADMAHKMGFGFDVNSDKGQITLSDSKGSPVAVYNVNGLEKTNDLLASR